jgi:hypothetical protein
MAGPVRVQLDTERKIRDRNKLYYRVNHWPIWIAVFFLVPGPLIFDLFNQGFDWRLGVWLAIVVVGTGIAGLFAQLPGCEERPYIIRFTEDKPNPAYRRICYTFAWGAVLSFAILNWVGLATAAFTGKWFLKQIYQYGYFPVVFAIWIMGAFQVLPRVRASTKGEGHERRYFYGSVWAVCVAQPLLFVMWKTVPAGQIGDWFKLIVYTGALTFMGYLAWRGVLPRTQVIRPGELAVSD